MLSRTVAFLESVLPTLVGGARACSTQHAPGNSSPAVVIPPSSELEGLEFPVDVTVVSALRKKLYSLRLRGVETASIVRGEACAKAVEQLRVLLQFLGDMGMVSDVPLHHRESFTNWLALLNLVDRAEAYLKWKFAHLACLCLGQSEFPLRPSWVDPSDRPDVLMGGSCHRFVRRMVHERSYTFGWNISQLKKGMPIVSDSFVDSSLEKTVAALSTDKSGENLLQAPQPWLDDIFPDDEVDWETGEGPRAPPLWNVNRLTSEVKRTVREIFPEGWYRPQPIYIPSISGHFFTKRSGTGAMGAIVRDRVEHHDYELMISHLPPKSMRWQLSTELPSREGFTDEPLYEPCGACKNEIHGTRFCAVCGWHPVDSLVVMEPNPLVNEVLLESLTYDREHAHCTLNAVRPQGLKEPFKARCITGGPEGKYYRSKYIQKATHSRLRRHPCAALIGETISPERLNAQLHPLGPDDFYVSGDYSAATDNLDPRLSDAVADEIGRTAGWDSDWIALYKETLTGHQIWNGGKDRPPTDHAALRERCVSQRWGQLMGSPTSFPVLCIVNLALTRLSLEARYGKVIGLRSSGILINGDDIGFVTDSLGYELWKAVTAAGGLEPSLGKNFCSRDFIVLNSTFYDISLRDGTRHLIYRPYINYGLLECRNENGTPIQDPVQALAPSVDPRTPDVGSLAHDLVKGHPEELQLVLLKRFMSRWKPYLQTFCPRGMSYWMPKHLGGLGLPIIGEFTSSSHSTRFSRIQRVLASYLSHDPEKAEELLSTSRISRSDSVSLWQKISSKSKRIMASIPFEWTKEPQCHTGGTVTSTLLAGAYAELSPDDVTETEEEKGDDRYRLWRKEYEQLFRHAEKSTFAPMSDEDIISDTPWRKKYADYTVVDFSPQVDLRCPPQRLSTNWTRPTISLVTEKVAEEEEDAMLVDDLDVL